MPPYHTLTWTASAPITLLKMLTNLWSLNTDLFSDTYNNCFSCFCCTPDSELSFLSSFVDAFSMMKQLPSLRVFCNPPFHSSIIEQTVTSILNRFHQKDMITTVIYLGPAHASLNHLYHHGHAIQLATFEADTLPFVHPIQGIMPPFPKLLELWCLSNEELPPTEAIVRALIHVRRKHPLIISHHIYEHAPSRVQRRLQFAPSIETLADLQQQQKALFIRHGQLPWGEIRTMHARIAKAATFLPIYHELLWRVGSVHPISGTCDDDTCDESHVYVITCTCCHLIYVGSTTRPVWTRFREELGVAKRAGHFPITGAWRRRLNLTDHLLLHGMEHSVCWQVRTIPGIHPDWICKCEFNVMTLFPRERLLNNQVPHNTRVTLHPRRMTVCRQGILDILTDDKFMPLRRAMQQFGIRELANKLITSTRIVYDARTLLLLYKHLTFFFSQDATLLIHFKRCMIRRLKVMHCRLPLRIVIRVPQMTSHEQQLLMSSFKHLLQSVQLYPLLEYYYLSSVRFVRTQAAPLGRSIHNFRRILDCCTGPLLCKLRDQPLDSCPCTLLGDGLPRMNGHVLFRPTDLDSTTPISVGHQLLTTAMITGLQQNMHSIPQLTPQERWLLLYPKLKTMKKSLIPAKYDVSTFYAEAKTILHQSAVNTTGFGTRQQARKALRLLKGCCCGPLDKNPSAIWISCNTLYLLQLYHKFLGPTGIGGFVVLPSIVEGSQAMHNAVTQHHFMDRCAVTTRQQLQRHGYGHIPKFYLLYKNKMFSFPDGNVKLRPITSHFHHPFRMWASRYTRGLSVMLKLATSSLGPTVSLHCANMLDSINWWKRGSAAYTDLSHLKLFEFDISDMYYHIPKQECWTLLVKFFAMFRTMFKRRSTAINKGSRHLDRIGCGSSEIYTNIPIVELLQFCHFELFGNVYAHVGLICFQQTKGIPMGGFPSGIIAQIYLFMRELKFNALHLTHHFFTFRYMDNIPGLYDPAITSLEQIHDILHYIYDMPLKLEQHGLILDSLEVRLILQPHQLLFYHKPLLREFFLPALQPDTSIQRLPPLWCANFKRFLSTYVSNTLLKCVRFCSDYLGFVIGVVNLIRDLHIHGVSLAQLLALFKQFCVRHYIPMRLFEYVQPLLQNSDLFPP